MVMTFGICDHMIESMLDVLETHEFGLGESKIKRVAIIQFKMSKQCG